MLFDLFKQTPNLTNQDIPIRELDCWVIDGEMSGRSSKEHSLLSFAAIPIPGKRMFFNDARNWLLKPDELNVDPEATLIHRIGHEDIAKGSDERVVAEEISELLNGTVVVGHNVTFDIGFLRSLFSRHGLKCEFESIDTGRLMYWYEQLINPHVPHERPFRRMDDLVEAMNLPVYREHDAFNDCIMTGSLFLRLLCEVRKAGYSTLKELKRLS